MNLEQFKEMSQERQYNSLRRTLSGMNYSFQERGDYDLNIIAIRSEIRLESTKRKDLLAVAYMIDGIKKVNLFNCTTDPSRTYRMKPLPKDEKVLIPQHVDAGFHMVDGEMVQFDMMKVLTSYYERIEIPTMSLLSFPDMYGIYDYKEISSVEFIMHNNYGTRVCNLMNVINAIKIRTTSKFCWRENLGLYRSGDIVITNRDVYKNEFMPLMYKGIANEVPFTLLPNNKLK
jgi:hypothetical protein